MTNPTAFEEKKATLISNLNDTRSSILEAAASIPDSRVDEAFVGSWGILELLAHLRGWDLTNIQAAKDILSGAAAQERMMQGREVKANERGNRRATWSNSHGV